MQRTLIAASFAIISCGCLAFTSDLREPTGRSRATTTADADVRQIVRSSLDVRADGNTALTFDAQRVRGCADEHEIRTHASRTAAIVDLALGAVVTGVGIWAGTTQCHSGAKVRDEPQCLLAIGIIGGPAWMLHSGVTAIVPDGATEWDRGGIVPCDGATPLPLDVVNVFERNGEHQTLRRGDRGFTAEIPVEELERTWFDAGGSRFAATAVVPEAAELSRARPASLTATVTLEDDGHDQTLDARESARLSVEVANHGIGTAYASMGVNLDANADVESDEVDDTAVRITPGASHTFTGLLHASARLPDGILRGQVVVHEARGYGPDPVPIVIATRRERLPALRLVRVQIDDYAEKGSSKIGNGNGIADPNEMVRMILTVENSGEGVARNVRVGLRSTDDSEVNVTEPRVQEAGNLKPKERTDRFFFVFIRSAAASGNKLEYRLTINDEPARQTPLNIEVGRPVKTTFP